MFVHIFRSPGVQLWFYQRNSCDKGEGGPHQIDESPLHANRGPPSAHVACACALFSSETLHAGGRSCLVSGHCRDRD